jgi:two-component system chemotaxis response regulator CheY
MDATLSQLTVLIVDENMLTRAMIRDILRSLGIRQVFQAANGATALTLFRQTSDIVNVVLSDWDLGDMTGLQLVVQIHQQAPKLPFLIVSGLTDREHVTQAAAAGVTGFLAKPFSRAQLESKLGTIAQRLALPVETRHAAAFA